MRVLITGATGLIGSSITKLCLEKRIEVYYLTTSKEKIENSQNYKGFYWNPKENKIDENCIEGVDKIINLVGASVAERWTDEQKKAIIDSRVECANVLYNLLDKKENKVTQIVSASAIGIYPDSLTKLYHEDSPNVADNFLGNVVIEWERAVNKFQKLGIEVAKIRIGVVLGEGGGALQKMKEPIENGFGSPLGSGKQWQSWIHIEDLARIFLFALEKDLEGVYNGVAPNPVTNKKLTNSIAKVLNKNLWMPNVPAFMLKLILGEMATIVLASQLVSNQKIDAHGFKYHYSHILPALKDILK
ncbi:TIGR01777 family oxidoreductase [Mesonia ostreae]|uniref:TIGR01777 family oxidoreductase n=1 Tax=Mesonia ostreae TaxID=861110 RepID=A0ABU2KEC8_9FLAO|nr:TIGR01777 family oxidoreductase [Mesonia ostreae]MDT0293058.1 TIGR01777 family oxidoreductase [Mesonia ostreae]